MEQQALIRDHGVPSGGTRCVGPAAIADGNPHACPQGRRAGWLSPQPCCVTGALVLDCPTDGLDAAAVEIRLRQFRRGRHRLRPVRTALADDAAAELTSTALRRSPSTPGRPCPGTRSGSVLTMDAVTVTRGPSPPPIDHAAAGGGSHLRRAERIGKTLMLATLGLLDHQGELDAPTTGWAPTGMDAAFSNAPHCVNSPSAPTPPTPRPRWSGRPEKWRTSTPWTSPALRGACRRRRSPGRRPGRDLDEPTVGLTPRATPGSPASCAAMRRGVPRRPARGRCRTAVDEGLPAVLWSCHNATRCRINDAAVQLA